jgi:hypothetical protein
LDRADLDPGSTAHTALINTNERSERRHEEWCQSYVDRQQQPFVTMGGWSCMKRPRSEYPDLSLESEPEIIRQSRIRRKIKFRSSNKQRTAEANRCGHMQTQG